LFFVIFHIHIFLFYSCTIHHEKIFVKSFPCFYKTQNLWYNYKNKNLKFPLQGIDFQIEGAKVRPIGFFKFTDTSGLQEAITKYTQGMLAVEPRIFVANLNRLKGEVFTAFDRPENKE